MTVSLRWNARHPLRRLIRIASAALVLFWLALSALAQAPAVRIAGGELHGVTLRGVSSFKGIPYAAPPVGNLRWRAPQRPAAWTAARDAINYGPDCAQTPNPGDPAYSTVPFSEDCLYLNVWKPDLADARPLPVLVWIHGGGYFTGGSSPAIYDGSGFARQGLVMVSFNYRLGRFGFFTHPALLRAREGESGNFAFMDMLAALAWVRDNIAAFGGDAARVTIMGESAGGDAVAHLIASPRAKGLFQQAVILSGNGREHLLGGLRMDLAAVTGQAFAESEGIAGSEPTDLVALRELPAERLSDRLNLPGLLQEPEFFVRTFVGGPIVDGTIVPGPPGKAIISGSAAKVRLMIGTTVDDIAVRWPMPNDPLGYFGPDRTRAGEAYATQSTETPAFLSRLIGVDITMHEPARFVAREMSRHGQRAFLYRFDYVAEAERKQITTGAPHASELPYLFGTVDEKYGARTTDADRAMAKLFSGAIARFARTGDPNGGELPAWPGFGESPGQIMLFDRTGAAQYAADPWRARLDLVEIVQDARLNGLPTALRGTTWRWIGFTSPAKQISVDLPDRYTVAFEGDTRIAVRADCNRGSATAGAPTAGMLRIGPLAMTRMSCAPGSLSDRFVKDLANAVRYAIRGQELTLVLADGAGTLRFARAR